MRHAVVWVVLWVCGFWLWLLFAGDWNRYEWIAAACEASVAASLGTYVRWAAHAGTPVGPRWLPKAAPALAMVPVDFGILMWALVRSLGRREVVRGTLHLDPIPRDTSEGVRAWLTYAANFSPNAYVVEVDREQRRALVHDLVPNPPSSDPL